MAGVSTGEKKFYNSCNNKKSEVLLPGFEQPDIVTKKREMYLVEQEAACVGAHGHLGQVQIG